MGQDKQITGAVHQTQIVSAGLAVLCSPGCTEGRGRRQKSWGNRSSTLIRAGVLLKISAPSRSLGLRRAKHRYFTSDGESELKIRAVDQDVLPGAGLGSPELRPIVVLLKDAPTTTPHFQTEKILWIEPITVLAALRKNTLLLTDQVSKINLAKIFKSFIF